jgi:hypothetical protein
MAASTQRRFFEFFAAERPFYDRREGWLSVAIPSGDSSNGTQTTTHRSASRAALVVTRPAVDLTDPRLIESKETAIMRLAGAATRVLFLSAVLSAPLLVGCAKQEPAGGTLSRPDKSDAAPSTSEGAPAASTTPGEAPAPEAGSVK